MNQKNLRNKFYHLLNLKKCKLKNHKKLSKGKADLFEKVDRQIVTKKPLKKLKLKKKRNDSQMKSKKILTINCHF